MRIGERSIRVYRNRGYIRGNTFLLVIANPSQRRLIYFHPTRGRQTARGVENRERSQSPLVTYFT